MRRRYYKSGIRARASMRCRSPCLATERQASLPPTVPAIGGVCPRDARQLTITLGPIRARRTAAAVADGSPDVVADCTPCSTRPDAVAGCRSGACAIGECPRRLWNPICQWRLPERPWNARWMQMACTGLGPIGRSVQATSRAETFRPFRSRRLRSRLRTTARSFGPKREGRFEARPSQAAHRTFSPR